MIWSWGLYFCALGACLIHAFFIRRMRLTTQIRQATDSDNRPLRDKQAAPPGVSVIVCARNEAARLDKLIPIILDQSYPHFELLVVDDHSSDNTQEVLTHWNTKDSRVRPVVFRDQKDGHQGKKHALTFGIKQATHDLLLLTDADCIPGSRHWIEHMTAVLQDNYSIVLGYGGYFKRVGVLNALIRFETVLTAGLYLGQAIAGHSYMGVGRNLAYRKTFFRAQNGFKSHLQIPSGDDDLLVNHGTTATNTAVVLDPMAFTWSLPKESWRSLFRQKRRHQSTAHHYRNKTKLMLGMYSGSVLLFYLCITTLSLSLPWNSLMFQALMALIILRSLYLIIQLDPVFKKFQSTDLRLWIPILEPLLMFLQLIIFVWNRFSKPTHWN